MTVHPARPARLFTFRSGGWVLLVALLTSGSLMAWALSASLMRERLPGDGQTIESYAFDLSTLLIDPDLIDTPMLHRDMPPRLDEPRVLTPEQVRQIDEEQRGKYLVPNDRVVGLVINGEARAYPISVLTVHEIINDTLADVPIAVTYNWLGDSVRVFDRRVGGETLSFGVSGLVYNANLLMYDRRDDPDVPYELRGESLWSQLQGRAVSGPAAKRELSLETISAQLISWRMWQEMHPETTVIARDDRFIKRYRRAGPDQYFLSPSIPYKVSPLPEHGPAWKDRVIVINVVDERGQRTVYSHALIAERAVASGIGSRPTWTDTVGDVQVTFTHDAASNTVAVKADGEIDIVHCFWFAWYAMHSEDELAE